MTYSKAEVKELVQVNVVKFLETGDSQYANDAFEILQNHEWKAKLSSTAQKLGGDYAAALSLYGEKFLDCLDKYDPEHGTPFVHYVNRAVTNGVNDAGTKAAKIRKTERQIFFGDSSTEGGMDDDSSDALMVDDSNVPVDVQVSEMSVEERDMAMQTIVRDIMSKAEPREIEILISYADTRSLQQTAEAFDTNKVNVMRTIDRMKKYYDAERFGNIHDYFTVPTAQSRGTKKGGRKA